MRFKPGGTITLCPVENWPMPVPLPPNDKSNHETEKGLKFT